MWIILNANNWQWGDDSYPTAEIARKELRAFFKGVSGVRFERFSIKERCGPEIQPKNALQPSRQVAFAFTELPTVKD